MKLQTKVLLWTFPFAVTSAVLLAKGTRLATQNLMIRELGARLRPQAEDAASGLAEGIRRRDERFLLPRLQAAQAFSGAVFAEALDLDGSVLANTNVLEVGKRRDDKKSREGMGAEETAFVRECGPRGPLLILSTPVWRPSEEFLMSARPRRRLGTLRLGLKLDETLDSARRVGVIVAWMAVGFYLLGLGLALALLRFVLKPVLAISEATTRVAAGNYGVEVPESSNDELGDLARAFNRMGKTLSQTTVSRDRLEEALAISRATIEASADGILVVDRNLQIVTCNRRFVEMWGISDEISRSGDAREIAKVVKERVEDPEAFARLTMKPFEDDEPEQRNVIHLKDGRVFDRISQPYRLDGAIVGRMVTVRDLTLHLEGVRALAQARDEAVETARAKSRFLANVSHELRTPLNAVVGASNLLRDTPLSVEQAGLVRTLEQAARGLLEVINGVLDFSKIEAGRMTIERERLRVDALLTDAAALIAPRAAEKGLTLRVDAGDAASLELLGDAARLRQILVNLLANAVKFTEQGGVAAEVQVLSRTDSVVELEFAVHDTGVGIPPEQASGLFSPFTQAEGSAMRYEGTGLGLAISKSLVELMGGAIGFDSVPGKGTRFWFRVKLDHTGAPAPHAAAAPAVRAAAARRDRLRVLVVEDNEVNRGLLERQLERLGCPCVGVTDGRAALEALRREDFGLILMDSQMPGMDGCQTAAEIRRLEKSRRHTPIIAITANVTEEERRRCLSAGMDDFEGKPLTLESLSAALARWDRPFDPTALGTFAATAADSPKAMARLVQQFLDDAAKRLAACRDALAADRGDERSRQAHALKGACLSIGARGLAELARRLEAAASETDARALLGQADAELERLRADAAGRRPK